MHLLTPAHLCSGLRERSRAAAGADRLLRRRHRVFQRNHQPLDLRVRRICTRLHTCWCRSKNFENFFVREQRSLSHSLCRYIFRRLRWLGSRLLSHLIALLFLALWHGLYSGESDNNPVHFNSMPSVIKNVFRAHILHRLSGGILVRVFHDKH